MSKDPVIAIAGATGLVGSEMINILNQRGTKASEVKLLASKNSVGEVYSCCGFECAVEELGEDSFKGVDIALFATSSELSAKYVPIAAEAGAFCIDNSSHFRMKEGIPLVVPEVNPEFLDGKHKIIANPNCSTIQLMPVLCEINKISKLKRVVVSTYQSVSGAGKNALDELWEQTRSLYNQTEHNPECFLHQIAFNCIPQIDVFMDNGYTKEEYKIINESRKILGLPNLRITATAVRVPVMFGHSESVNIETESEISPEKLVEILSNKKGIQVFPNQSDYPMQINVAGEDDVFVGRIRKDDSVENGLAFWVVADNVRKGAALNAVQIAEYFI